MAPSATADVPTLSSPQLLQRLSAADAAAWTELLHRFGAQMLNVTRRILGDNALAEDAVQESLLLIRDHAGTFRPEGADAEAAVRRWIVRIACTTALQMLRKAKQTAKREAQYVRLNNAAPAAGAAEHAAQAEAAALVRRELAQLPDAYRLPITLHILGGLTFQDVAAELRCPIGTAKTNVHRGLERLRKHLAVFGILIPLSELAEHLHHPGLPPEVPSVQQLAQWQTLLHSSAKPAYALTVAKGGLTFMAKSAVGLTAAALLTTAAITFTSARTAEQKPTVQQPPVSAAPTAPAAPAASVALPTTGPSFDADPKDPQWLAALKKKLQTKVTMEFENADLNPAITMIRQLSGTTLVVLPDAAQHASPFTIKVKDESLASALQRAIAQERLHYDFVAGGLVIGDADDLKIVKAAKVELSPQLEAKLQRSVTFEFVDQSFGDGTQFLSSLTKFKVQFENGADKFPVSFRASDIPLRDALLWMLILTGTGATEKDGVLVVAPAKKTIKFPEPQPTPAAADPKAKTAAPNAPVHDKVNDEF